MLQFRHMGGALAREAPGAGARATLPGEISMLALGLVFDGPSDAAVRSALADVEAALLPHRAGDYPNFVEEPADASGFFDADTWGRLRLVKAAARPERPLQGQPSHPASRAELKGPAAHNVTTVFPSAWPVCSIAAGTSSNLMRVIGGGAMRPAMRASATRWMSSVDTLTS
jgi:hypothetical protein